MCFKSVFLNIIFVVVIVGVHSVHAQPLSNLAFLSSLSDSVVGGIFSSVLAEPEPVHIRSIEEHPADWFLQNTIVETLKKADFSDIYVNQSSNDHHSENPFFLCEFKLLHLGIRYLHVYQDGKLRQQQLRRVGEIDTFFQISEQPAGRIVWNGKIRGARSDTVSVDEVEALENRNILFTIGEKPEKTGGTNFLEPAVITGVTGIIIFLFYSIRSR